MRAYINASGHSVWEWVDVVRTIPSRKEDVVRFFEERRLICEKCGEMIVVTFPGAENALTDHAEEHFNEHD
jgi:hypothetical protein